MKYFTVDELRKGGREEIMASLKDYVGRNIRDSFAADLVARYSKQLFNSPLSELGVLDYGVASGAFAEQLSEKGFRDIYGLDLDNYLSEKNSKLVKEFKIVDLNLDALPWANDFFQVVTAWCVLPHLENPHHCIRETLRVLRPGGLFILSIPHLMSKASINYFLKHEDFSRYAPQNNHIAVFTPGVFQNTVLRYFEKVNMEYLIDPRIFQGLRGKLRKLIFDLSDRISFAKKYLEKLWGYNQIWILRKPL